MGSSRYLLMAAISEPPEPPEPGGGVTDVGNVIIAPTAFLTYRPDEPTAEDPMQDYPDDLVLGGVLPSAVDNFSTARVYGVTTSPDGRYILVGGGGILLTTGDPPGFSVWDLSTASPVQLPLPELPTTIDVWEQAADGNLNTDFNHDGTLLFGSPVKYDSDTYIRFSVFEVDGTDVTTIGFSALETDIGLAINSVLRVKCNPANDTAFILTNNLNVFGLGTGLLHLVSFNDQGGATALQSIGGLNGTPRANWDWQGEYLYTNRSGAGRPRVFSWDGETATEVTQTDTNLTVSAAVPFSIPGTDLVVLHGTNFPLQVAELDRGTGILSYVGDIAPTTAVNSAYLGMSYDTGRDRLLVRRRLTEADVGEAQLEVYQRAGSTFTRMIASPGAPVGAIATVLAGTGGQDSIVARPDYIPTQDAGVRVPYKVTENPASGQDTTITLAANGDLIWDHDGSPVAGRWAVGGALSDPPGPDFDVQMVINSYTGGLEVNGTPADSYTPAWEQMDSDVAYVFSNTTSSSLVVCTISIRRRSDGRVVASGTQRLATSLLPP